MEAVDPATAEALWLQTLAAHPDDPEALFQLGNLAQARGDTATAIARFEQALAVDPGESAILNNLGLALERRGDLAAAADAFRRALAAAPAAFDARANLAQNLYQQHRYQDALAEFDGLVAAHPVTHASIWANRAVCQLRCDDPDGALTSFRRAIHLAPGTASLHCDTGALLWSQKRYEEARSELTRCLALDPGNALASHLIAVVHNYLADWHDFAARRKRLLSRAAGAGRSIDPDGTSFNVQAISDDPALELSLARSWMVELATTTAARPARVPAADGRLRLGFASLDFHDHPVGRLVVDLLERLDRNRFSVTVYAMGARPDDAVAARIERAADRFRIGGRTDPAAHARMIRGDDIDVLFDLNGFTRRLADVFVLRPAPMQVNFLGYTGTLGLDCYDCIVADRYCLPDADRVHYAERPLYVDPCYLPSDPARSVDAAAVQRADYGLPANAFVLCAPAAPYKIMPEMFELWLTLMGTRDDAVLWLRGSEPSTMARLAAEAKRRGADPARIVFAPADPNPRYLARMRLANLALDTWPFGAHTSVNDALFAGLPVVTRTGRSFASRASASQLHAAGMPELVAASAGEYIAIGGRLMEDAAGLAALTRRLRDEGPKSPLFDMARYARAFEFAVLSAWREGSAAGDRGVAR
ncbi:MAG: tetratricopeptide repeat protein [Betaproteobacteria bacterium]